MENTTSTNAIERERSAHESTRAEIAKPTTINTVTPHTIKKYEPSDGVPERRLGNGAFLFTAYGCVLSERQTPSGMYVYTAVNIATGKTAILSRREKKLAESGFLGLAAKISELPIRGDSLLNIDKKPGESAKAERLTEIASHIFKEILPQYDYTIREKQIELAAHILDVIGRGGLTLAESEVGTGKTHAYLIAATLAKRGRVNDFHLSCRR
ncbi:MAG: hypothetical protein LBK98_04980, partial [Peptococcaceae bacterium]|nr:hypothetical protein [Peptococcaceae bacterium]